MNNKELQTQYIPPELEDDSDNLVEYLLELYYLLRRNWSFMLLTFILVVGAGVFYTVRQTKIYEAVSLIIVKMESIRPLGRQVETLEQTDYRYYGYYDEFRQTQLKVISSDNVLSKVIESLQLDKDVDFMGLRNVEPEELKELEEKLNPVAILASRIEASVIKNSEIIEIKARDPDPARAALISNAVVEAYKVYLRETKSLKNSFATEWLDEQALKLKERLTQAEQEMHDFQSTAKIYDTSFESRKEYISSQLNTLKTKYSAMKTEHWNIKAELGKITSLNHSEENLNNNLTTVIHLLGNNPKLLEISKSLFVLQQKMHSITSEYGEKHPLYQKTHAELEGTRKALSDEIRFIIEAKTKRKEIIEFVLQNYEREIAELEEQAIELNKASIAYKRLSTEIDNFRGLYELVLKRSKETQISDITQFSDVQVVEPAKEPFAPVLPKTRLNVLLSMVLGVFAAFAVGFAKDKIDNKVKSIEEVELIVNRPYLGHINNISPEALAAATQNWELPAQKETSTEKAKVIFYPYFFPKSQDAEAVRFIRTNVMFSSPSRHHTTFVVTSSLAGEGKTSVINFLGMSLASIGKKVIIVDCDLRKPMIHKIHGLDNDLGVTSMIVENDTENLERYIRPSIVPNLDLITSGHTPPDPTEHISSPRMGELIASLQNRYDYVLIDSPPILPVTDALLVSQHCHNIVFVIDPSVCDRYSLKDAVKRCQTVGTPLLGFIWNNINVSKFKYYGKSSKYYYYSSHYKYDYSSKSNA